MHGAVGVLTASSATSKNLLLTHAHQTPPDGNYFTVDLARLRLMCGRWLTGFKIDQYISYLNSVSRYTIADHAVWEKNIPQLIFMVDTFDKTYLLRK